MRKNTRTMVSGLMAMFLVTACASSGAPGMAGGRQDRLTREQIMAPNVTSLYDVIQRLRPRWLEATGGEPSSLLGGANAIVVYQGQSLLGGPEVLRRLSPDMAGELQYLDGPTASATLPGIGTRHVSGAIVIHLRTAG